MFFKDIIGQDEIKQHLIQEADNGTVPHAMLFCGPEGTGKLQMAVALASYLLCQKPDGKDSCGSCPSCFKMKKLVHPDLHFVFPVINKSKSSASRKTISDDELPSWRQMILDNLYFGFEDWLEALDAGDKQAMIYTEESESIITKLSLTSTEGGYKILIIWQPEKMHANCANSLLKLLEEPPAKTLFILVSNAPEQILETVLSRTQRIDFKPIPENIICEYLQGPAFRIEPTGADEIARLSCGSWLKAKKALQIQDESREYLDSFMQLMRLSYSRRLKDLKLLDDTLAGKGREWQKRFFIYCQRMIRENFIMNFRRPELNYMTDEEKQFSTKFAPFVNEKNIIGIMDELSEAQRHIEQNVNAKMVFFDLSMKVILLLK
jgi:DNA polymerase III subunit delta'